MEKVALGVAGEAGRSLRATVAEATSPLIYFSTRTRNRICPCGSDKKYKGCCGGATVN